VLGVVDCLGNGPPLTSVPTEGTCAGRRRPCRTSRLSAPAAFSRERSDRCRMGHDAICPPDEHDTRPEYTFGCGLTWLLVKVVRVREHTQGQLERQL
jgi:hypothetical protein